MVAISPYIKKLRAKIGTDVILMPGVAGVVINPEGYLLLHRRSDNGMWWLPGGALEPGEEPADAVVREVYEETGVKVIPERLSCILAGEDHFVVYPNGDQAAILSMTFLCRPIGGDPRIDGDESLEVRYFPIDALPPLAPRILHRIQVTLRNEPVTLFRFNDPLAQLEK